MAGTETPFTDDQIVGVQALVQETARRAFQLGYEAAISVLREAAKVPDPNFSQEVNDLVTKQYLLTASFLEAVKPYNLPAQGDQDANV